MLSKSILVVGGGISGLTAAIEVAEVGYEVFLVERNPYLGGRVTRMNLYFPKLCPPNCGLEINFKRIRSNPNIKFFTLATVENISGREGDFDVTIRLDPRYVNENCTACGQCVEVCPAKRSNDFNFGLDSSKAIYLPHDFAFPLRYVMDVKACHEGCNKCVEACRYGAVVSDMTSKTRLLKVGAVIWATGWQPYNAEKISYYGYGRFPNVIDNMIMERLAAVNGPTGGKIVRPSDGRKISSIAFIQCAGSRDENHQLCCSAVCCMVSLKQTYYIREQYPQARICVYYIDIRTRGIYEDFYVKAQEEANVTFIKGKAGEIMEDPDTGDLIVIAEDQLAGKVIEEKFDMVVLATGMVPSTQKDKVPADVLYDVDGFVAKIQKRGIYSAGCVHKPQDVSSSVQEATAAALKAIQSVRGLGDV